MADWNAFFSSTKFKVAVALASASLILFTMLRRFSSRRYKLPPGPWGLPFVGYLPFFGKDPPATFNRLRKTYGDIFRIRLGSWPAVVLNGRDVIREALVQKGDDFSGRNPFVSSSMPNKGRSYGLGPFGDLWKIHSKVLISMIDGFNNTKNSMVEDIVRTEVNTVIAEFEAHGESSFNPQETIEVAAYSMVYQLCYGKQHAIRENQDFLAEIADERSITQMRQGNIVDVMPWLRFILRQKIEPMRELIHRIEQRRIARVEDHEATYNGNVIRDMTDGLIHAGNSLSAEDLSAGLDKERVVETLDFLRQAGGGTVSAQLQWMILQMAAFPEVQDKVFKEVSAVVGQDRAPRLEDQSKLPFVEATIAEVLRYSYPFPLVIPHATTCDTRLHDLDIPQGTVVLVNLYSIYTDKDIWGDPENFRPERFLSSEGQLDKSLLQDVPAFSIGRRRCTGEQLARKELFLFFATIMQRLKVSRPPHHPQYTTEGQLKLAREPVPFEVCVTPRK